MWQLELLPVVAESVSPYRQSTISRSLRYQCRVKRPKTETTIRRYVGHQSQWLELYTLSVEPAILSTTCRDHPADSCSSLKILRCRRVHRNATGQHYRCIDPFITCLDARDDVEQWESAIKGRNPASVGPDDVKFSIRSGEMSARILLTQVSTLLRFTPPTLTYLSLQHAISCSVGQHIASNASAIEQDGQLLAVRSKDIRSISTSAVHQCFFHDSRILPLVAIPGDSNRYSSPSVLYLCKSHILVQIVISWLRRRC